jgi:hypothetical protein
VLGIDHSIGHVKVSGLNRFSNPFDLGERRRMLRDRAIVEGETQWCAVAIYPVGDAPTALTNIS